MLFRSEFVDANYGELLLKPTNPTRDEYNFDGWYKDSECTELWDFDTDRIYGNTTLYAKWTSSTSIENMNDDKIIIFTSEGKIIVSNTNTPIVVYSIAGAVVRTIPQPSAIEFIDIESGCYIVRTGSISAKAVVN